MPNGVATHRIECLVDKNAAGFTDVLIKHDGREIATLPSSCGATAAARPSSYLTWQQADDLGAVRGVRLKLDVADVDCRPSNIVLVRTLRPDGKVAPNARSQCPILWLHGRAANCNSVTRLSAVGGKLGERRAIAMRAALLNQVDIARLRGFKITRAGAPNPISRP